ncbi:MAG: glycosyltransferase family 4 protein [Bacteroidota bacterium]
MNLKVLMLGWEYPPETSGGLGKASLEISRALSDLTDLTVIVPSGEESLLPQGEIISLARESSKEKVPEGHEIYLQILSNAELALLKSKMNPYASLAEVFLPVTSPHLQEVLAHKAPNYLSSQQGLPFQVDTGVGVPAEEERERSMSLQPIPTNEPTPILSIEDIKALLPLKLKELYGENMLQDILSYSKAVAGLVQANEYDIIHAHDWMTFLAGLEVKAQHDIPLVLHVHSLEYDRSGLKTKNWIFQVEQFAMEQADLIIPVSQYTANIITDIYGVDADKILPIHNAVSNVDAFVSARKFPEKLVVFLGRITRQKGPAFFVELAEKALKENEEVRFVMAGKGDLTEAMMDVVAAKRLGNKFHFTGFLTQALVQELLSITDVLVMPSVSEPFGLVAIEAAQFGVPCVISRQSGVSEILKGAVQLNYWETDKMLKEVLNLLENEVYYQKVATQQHEDLTVNWEDTAQKILKAYQTIVA